jgi:3-oxoacyl-[acyl-carrier protein] reductase
MNHQNKGHAIVAGGASGIGRAIVEALASEGRDVSILDLDLAAAERLAGSIRIGSGDAAAFEVDLTDAVAVARVIGNAVGRFGSPDVLVNVSRGGIHGKKGEGVPAWSEFGPQFTAFLAPLVDAVRAVVPFMERAGRGSIVNLASVAAFAVGEETVAYHGAKAAIVQLTRVLAVEYGPKGIRVNCVAPGLIVRDEHRERFSSEENSTYRATSEAVHPLRRVGSPAEVAAVVRFLGGDDASFVTGQTIVVDGGLTLQDQFALGSRLDGRRR